MYSLLLCNEPKVDVCNVSLNCNWQFSISSLVIESVGFGAKVQKGFFRKIFNTLQVLILPPLEMENLHKIHTSLNFFQRVIFELAFVKCWGFYNSRACIEVTYVPKAFWKNLKLWITIKLAVTTKFCQFFCFKALKIAFWN